MARKKIRRKSKRREAGTLSFDMPKIEVSKMGISSFNSGYPTQKKVGRKNKKKDTFDLNFDVPPLNLDHQEQKRINPSKIPKVKLVGILSKQLSINQVYQSLIRLGKHRLADEFLSEVEFVNKKYGKMLMEIEGKVEESVEDEILNKVVDEIISHMKRLYSISFKPRGEIDFHKQIEPFLIGLASVFETSLTKFGWNINVNREYRFPSNERVDLLISVGNAKIGIEVKYDLKETSKLQRLLGQIDRYIPYLDSLIIISYLPLNSSTIKAIKDKEIEKRKSIRIVTPNKII